MATINRTRPGQTGFLLTFPGATRDQYYAVINGLGLTGPADGGLLHLAGFGSAGLSIADAWENPEAFGEFGQVLGPELARHGIAAPQVTQVPIHRLLVQDGADLGNPRNVLVISSFHAGTDDYDRVFAAVGGQLPEENLAHWAGSIGGRLYVAGVFTSQQAYSQLLTQLQELPEFAALQPAQPDVVVSLINHLYDA